MDVDIYNNNRDTIDNTIITMNYMDIDIDDGMTTSDTTVYKGKDDNEISTTINNQNININVYGTASIQNIDRDSINFVNGQILNLYKCLVQMNLNDNDEPNCLFGSSIYHLLHLIAEGMAGASKEEIVKNGHESFMKRLIDESPKPSHRRSGVFIREGYFFNQSYLDKFSNNKDVILSVLPSNENLMNKVNEKALLAFPDWGHNEPFINTPVDGACRMYLKDESCFEGFWDEKFDSDNTKLADFHIGDNATVQIPMMINFKPSMFMYKDEAKRCDFFHVPYDLEDGGGLLIILPRKAMNKRELVEFCVNQISERDIIDFYLVNGKYKSCHHVRLPKFEFECHWDLGIGASGVFGVSVLDLRGVSSEFEIGFDSISAQSKTKFTVDECGTFIKTETAIIINELMDRGENVDIDRSFLFATIDKDMKMSSFGLYNGK